MSVPLFIPEPFYQIYAECIDDSMPKFKPDNWVKANRWYKVKWFAESLNTDEQAITIADKNDEIIHPSSSMSAFKSSRFIIHSICLN
jgi:hypothetical protein